MLFDLYVGYQTMRFQQLTRKIKPFRSILAQLVNRIHMYLRFVKNAGYLYLGILSQGCTLILGGRATRP